MKRLILAGFLLLILCVTMLSKSASSQDANNQLVGAWRLVWLEEEGADGKIKRANCTGQFVFTRDGHAAVQVMFEIRPPRMRRIALQCNMRRAGMRHRLEHTRSMRKERRLRITLRGL